MSHNNSFHNPYVLHINSHERESGTNEDFQSKISSKDLSMYDRVSVLQTSIPRTQYNVPEGQNTFSLIENIEKIITIRPGNYTLSSFKIEVVRALNEVSDYTFSVSFPDANIGNTYKLTFNITDNLGFQPKFKFYDYLWRPMGFQRGSLNSFVDDVLTSTGSVDLSGVNRVFIKSDICLEGLLESVLSYSTFPQLSVAYHYNSQVHLTSKPFNYNNRNGWRFQLVDSEGIVCNLNNVSWHMDLVFYKSVDTISNERLTRVLLEKEMFSIQQEMQAIKKEEESSSMEVNVDTSVADAFVENEFIKEIEQGITYTQDIHKQFDFMDDKYEPRIFEETAEELLEEVKEDDDPLLESDSKEV